jgi:hypothetical protein
MSRRSGNPIGDFITFRLMLTPFLLQALFWLGSLACVVIGGRMMAASFEPPADRPAIVPEKDPVDPDKAKVKQAAARVFSAVTFATGLALLLLGPFALRLYCEMHLIIFKIHDELKWANDRARYRE